MELKPGDAGCLWPFLAVHNFERYLLPFGKSFETITHNCAVVHEYILSLIGSDKSITLAFIEPLNGALSHKKKPPKTNKITDHKGGLYAYYVFKINMSRDILKNARAIVHIFLKCNGRRFA
jgi:hypothetical protein